MFDGYEVVYSITENEIREWLYQRIGHIKHMRRFLDHLFSECLGAGDSYLDGWTTLISVENTGCFSGEEEMYTITKDDDYIEVESRNDVVVDWMVEGSFHRGSDVRCENSLPFNYGGSNTGYVFTDYVDEFLMAWSLKMCEPDNPVLSEMDINYTPDDLYFEMSEDTRNFYDNVAIGLQDLILKFFVHISGYFNNRKDEYYTVKFFLDYRKDVMFYGLRLGHIEDDDDEYYEQP